MPSQPDTVKAENWRSLKLNIQVLSPSFSLPIFVMLVTNLQPLRVARFGTHRSRRTRTRLAATIPEGRPVQFN